MTRPKTKNTDPARVARVERMARERYNRRMDHLAGKPAPCWRCKGERVIRSHTDGIHYEVEPCPECVPAKAPTGMATRPDGITLEVTIPPREESEGALVVRLADEVIAAANEHRPENAPYVREDLEVKLFIAADGTTWHASLGRARVDGCRSPEEALTALRTIVKRYANTVRGA